MDVDVIEPVVQAREVGLPLRQPPALSYLSTAEVAECTCPEWCERDHDRD
jgi:hypothetical protein